MCLQDGHTVKAFPYLALIVACFLTGCMSAKTFQTQGAGISVSAVSQVTVAPLADQWAHDEVVWYAEKDVSDVLRAELVRALRAKGKLADKGPRLEFIVKDFRLRSGAVQFWVGWMAGNDILGGTAQIKEGAKTIKTVECRASGCYEDATGVLLTGNYPSKGRLKKLCQLVAGQVAEQL